MDFRTESTGCPLHRSHDSSEVHIGGVTDELWKKLLSRGGLGPAPWRTLLLGKPQTTRSTPSGVQGTCVRGRPRWPAGGGRSSRACARALERRRGNHHPVSSAPWRNTATPGPVAWREDDEIAGRFSQRCSVFRVIARRAHSGVAGLHGLPPEVAERSLRRNEANRSVSVPVAWWLGVTRSRRGRAVAIQRSARAPFACVRGSGRRSPDGRFHHRGPERRPKAPRRPGS